jgi:hypothetical protein
MSPEELGGSGNGPVKVRKGPGGVFERQSERVWRGASRDVEPVRKDEVSGFGH